MRLRRLELYDFRCFAQAALEPDPGFTLILGPNASGKTSLLEAVFFLGRGRSFRTAATESLVREGTAGFQIRGRLADAAGRDVPLGLAWQAGRFEARFDAQPVATLVELARHFPVLVIDSDVHRLIAEGPRWRRRYLDWLVFHVEPDFFAVWRRYQRALRQRNALLRSSSSLREQETWEKELVAAGEALDERRRKGLAALAALAGRLASEALGGLPVELAYRPGWSAELSFADALAEGRSRDQALGQTRVGPHRADLTLRVAGQPADEWVSRGQQKALAVALVLAQARLLAQVTGRHPLLLVDDLPAELDAEHQERVWRLLTETGGQVLMTAIHRQALPETLVARARLFHVEQGRLSAVEH